MFFEELVVPYLDSIDNKVASKEKIYHIPIPIGGFFANTVPNASFEFFDNLTEMIRLVSKDRYNIQVESRYSTPSEFFEKVRAQKTLNFPFK